jgi:hypothetical protein
VAGVKGKSGGANGGPQYNPANISATGGDGQSGKQPAQYISGLPYGQGQETMQQQLAAPMAAAATPQTSAMGMNLPTLLDTTARPNEPTSAGVDFGKGGGSEMLPSSLSQDQRPIENKAIVEKYLPALMQAGRSVDAPDSYKQFLSYLLKKMQ